MDKRHRAPARARARAARSERVNAELVEQGAIARGFGIAGGEELVAVEDRIRAGEEAQRLHCFGHVRAPGGEPHETRRHGDAGAGDGAHELAPIELWQPLERSTFDL